jgi:hypothetical protein
MKKTNEMHLQNRKEDLNTILEKIQKAETDKENVYQEFERLKEEKAALELKMQ